MDKLSLGMGPVMLGEEGADLRRRLARILADRLELKISIVATQSYSRLLRRAAAGDLDLAWLPPAVYVRLHDRVETTRIVLGSERARPGSYHGGLFVPPESDIVAPEALRGATVGWVDPSSSAGYLFPRFALLSRGLQPDTLFADERFFRSHDGVVQAVASGEVDAGATYVHMEGADASGQVVDSAWMQAGEDMRAILVSRSIPVDVVCSVGDLGGARPRVRDVLATLHEDAEGASILRSLLKVKRFAPVDPRAYQVVRSALNVAHLPVLGDD